MALEFREGSFPEPVVTVRFVCPHHEESVLVEVCRAANGRRWFKTYGDAFVSEFVTAEPVEMPPEGRDRASTIGLDAPVGSSGAGDVDHFRYRFTCSRPSCAYSHHRRDDEFFEFVVPLLDYLERKGIPEFTVPDLDATP